MKRVLAIYVVISLSVAACSSKSKTSDSPAASNASVTGSSAKAGNIVTCSQNSDVRELEVKKTSSGCELMYTKFGTAKAVANSSSGEKYCKEVRDKISTNLNRSGFKCE